ncbi:MAG: hypothetical protein EXR78_01320 [Deltaproteobacteria bacterium]|nr:hypothetical protein [Deltaproteobacteria bacterium]
MTARMFMPSPSRFNPKVLVLWKTLSLLTVLLGVWAFVIEPDQVTVQHIPIEVSQWHGEHHDLRIAVLSDLHIGAPHLDVEKLHAVVARTNSETPDIIVLLGDFVISGVLGGSSVEPERIAQELKNLRAPLGVIAVLGNHDWWYDGERVRNALQKARIRVLENEAIRVYRGPILLGCWFGRLMDQDS